jgi:hypothetical protein
MLTHRFGRRIKLPSTMAIKHQIRTLMARDEVRRRRTRGPKLLADNFLPSKSSDLAPKGERFSW